MAMWWRPSAEKMVKASSTRRLGLIRSPGRTKSTVAMLLDTFPCDGEDGGRGNDDDEGGHRIEPDLDFKRMRREVMGKRRGEWTKAA